MSYTKIRVDTDNLTEAIFKQVHHVRFDHNLTSIEVIMGAQDFSKLLRSDEFMHIAGFRYDEEIRWSNGASSRHSKVMGIEITVIPWMVGMVVIPRIKNRYGDRA